MPQHRTDDDPRWAFDIDAILRDLGGEGEADDDPSWTFDLGQLDQALKPGLFDRTAVRVKQAVDWLRPAQEATGKVAERIRSVATPAARRARRELAGPRAEAGPAKTAPGFDPRTMGYGAPVSPTFAHREPGPRRPRGLLPAVEPPPLARPAAPEFELEPRRPGPPGWGYGGTSPADLPRARPVRDPGPIAFPPEAKAEAAFQPVPGLVPSPAPEPGRPHSFRSGPAITSAVLQLARISQGLDKDTGQPAAESRFSQVDRARAYELAVNLAGQYGLEEAARGYERGLPSQVHQAVTRIPQLVGIETERSVIEKEKLRRAGQGLVATPEDLDYFDITVDGRPVRTEPTLTEALTGDVNRIFLDVGLFVGAAPLGGRKIAVDAIRRTIGPRTAAIYQRGLTGAPLATTAGGRAKARLVTGGLTGLGVGALTDFAVARTEGRNPVLEAGLGAIIGTPAGAGVEVLGGVGTDVLRWSVGRGVGRQIGGEWVEPTAELATLAARNLGTSEVVQAAAHSWGQGPLEFADELYSRGVNLYIRSAPDSPDREAATQLLDAIEQSDLRRLMQARQAGEQMAGAGAGGESFRPTYDRPVQLAVRSPGLWEHVDEIPDDLKRLSLQELDRSLRQRVLALPPAKPLRSAAEVAQERATAQAPVDVELPTQATIAARRADRVLEEADVRRRAVRLNREAARLQAKQREEAEFLNRIENLARQSPEDREAAERAQGLLPVREIPESPDLVRPAGPRLPPPEIEPAGLRFRAKGEGQAAEPPPIQRAEQLSIDELMDATYRAPGTTPRRPAKAVPRRVDKIEAAAVRGPRTGIVFEGRSHEAAIDEAVKAGEDFDELAAAWGVDDPEVIGYKTRAGHFLSRDEAMQRGSPYSDSKLAVGQEIADLPVAPPPAPGFHAGILMPAAAIGTAEWIWTEEGLDEDGREWFTLASFGGFVSWPLLRLRPKARPSTALDPAKAGANIAQQKLTDNSNISVLARLVGVDRKPVAMRIRTKGPDVAAAAKKLRAKPPADKAARQAWDELVRAKLTDEEQINLAQGIVLARPGEAPRWLTQNLSGEERLRALKETEDVVYDAALKWSRAALADPTLAAGKGWYREDIKGFEREAIALFPQMARRPGLMTIFKALVAITSAQSAPEQNIRKALMPFTNYLATNSFRPNAPNAFRLSPAQEDVIGGVDRELLDPERVEALKKSLKKVRGPRPRRPARGKRRPPRREPDFRSIQRVIDDQIARGRSRRDAENITALWLLQQAKIAGTDYGRHAARSLFGPKTGAFAANLMGLGRFATVDIWAMRSYYQAAGYMRLRRGGEDHTYRDWADWDAWDLARGEERFAPVVDELPDTYGVPKWMVAEAPTQTEREIINKAFDRVAETLRQETSGFDWEAMDVQALLWVFEKRRFEQGGARGTDEAGFYNAMRRGREWRDLHADAATGYKTRLPPVKNMTRAIDKALQDKNLPKKVGVLDRVAPPAFVAGAGLAMAADQQPTDEEVNLALLAMGTVATPAHTARALREFGRLPSTAALAALGLVLLNEGAESDSTWIGPSGVGVLGLALLHGVGSHRAGRSARWFGRQIMDLSDQLAARGIHAGTALTRFVHPAGRIEHIAPEAARGLDAFAETFAKADAMAASVHGRQSGRAEQGLARRVRAIWQTRDEDMQRARVDRYISDLVEKEGWEDPGLLTPEEIQLGVQFAAEEVDIIRRTTDLKLHYNIIPEAAKLRHGDRYMRRLYAHYDGAFVSGNYPVRNDVPFTSEPRISPQHRRVLDDEYNRAIDKYNALLAQADQGMTPQLRADIAAADQAVRVADAKRLGIRQGLAEIREASYRSAIMIEKAYKDVAAARLFETLRSIDGMIPTPVADRLDDFLMWRLLADDTPAGSPEEAMALGEMARLKKEIDTLAEPYKMGRFTRAYTTLPDTPAYGVLRGIPVQTDVALQIRSTIGDSWKLKQDPFTRFWKRNKTAHNPPTHIVNFTSNIGAVFVGAGINPFRQVPLMREALLDMREYQRTGKSQATQLLAEVGALNHNVVSEGRTGHELRSPREMRRLMRTADPRVRQELESQGLRDTPAAKFIDTLYELDEWAVGLYNTGDNIFRVMIVKDALRRGLDPEAAIELQYRTLGKFRTASPALQLLRWPFPFIMYSAKGMPAFVRNAIDHPWRFLMLAAVFGAVNEYSEAEVGAIDPADVGLRERRKKWGGYVLPGLTQLPMEGPAGEKVALDVSRMTPLSPLVSGVPPGVAPLASVSESFPSALAPTGPAVDVVATLLGVDPFTGRKKVDPATSTPDAAMRSFGELGARLVLPSALAWHAPRLHEAYQYGDPEAAKSAALGFVAARPRYIRPGEQQEYAVRDYETAVGKIESEARKKLARIHGTGPRQERLAERIVEKMVRDQEAAAKRLYKRLNIE